MYLSHQMYQREIKFPKRHSFFLLGPRQTGKSTLLKSSFDEERTYFYNLLRSEEYLRLKAEPSLFHKEVSSRPKEIDTIVVDEVQRIPLLLNEVHDLMQTYPELRFVLTGSSARKLKSEEANLLAGRALTYSMHPLTVREIPTNLSLEEILSFGTLPPILNESDLALKQKILQSYVETYLKEEIEAEARLKKFDSFIRFLTLAAFENGNCLNFSNLGRETATASKTVQAYFSLLEDSLIGFFLYPFHKSKRKRLAKHPKFYFFDTGVLRALQKRTQVPLQEKTPEFGAAFEHFILLELIRLNDYLNKDWIFSFFKTESGLEVDCIIETPRNELIAIEIKSTDRVHKQHLRALKIFSGEFQQAELFCVTRVPRPIQEGNVLILPWRDFLDKMMNL